MLSSQMTTRMEAEPPFEAKGCGLEVPRRHQVLIKVSGVLVLAALAAVTRHPLLIIVAVLGGLVAVAWPRSVVRRRGRVKVDAAGLHLRGKLVVPRAELGGGVQAENDDTSCVWLFGRDGRFALLVEPKSRKKSRKLLAALELLPDQQAPLILLKAGPAARWAWLLPAVIGGGGIVPIVLVLDTLDESLQLPVGALLAAAIAAVPLAFQLLGAKRLRLGTDGVAVRRLGRERFVPYDDIEGVELWKPHRHRTSEYPPRGFTLLLRGGDKLRLRTAEARQLLGSGNQAEPDYIAATIRARLGIVPETHPPAVLERNERSTAEWIAALRALCSREGGYRTAHSTADELWRVLEDPALPPKSRAAAVIALAAGASGDERKRLGFAAASSASRTFRAAVSAAQTGDDAALATALSRLDG